MYVERIVYPVEVLGTGKRIGIWTQGCPHHCQRCINPELWSQHEKNKIDTDRIVSFVQNICNNNQVDGITITGGDPFFQKSELRRLLLRLKEMNLEVLVYTGYTREQIINQKYGFELLNLIDVLIDGKYVDALNDESLALRGSSNQNIYYRSKEIKIKYQEYLSRGRQLQNMYLDGYMLSLGIHNKPKEVNCYGN